MDLEDGRLGFVSGVLSCLVLFFFAKSLVYAAPSSASHLTWGGKAWSCLSKIQTMDILMRSFSRLHLTFFLSCPSSLSRALCETKALVLLES